MDGWTDGWIDRQTKKSNPYVLNSYTLLHTMLQKKKKTHKTGMEEGATFILSVKSLSHSLLMASSAVWFQPVIL